MSILMQDLNEAYVSGIKTKYADRFDACAKVDTSFSDEQAMKLGIMLENTEQAFAKCGSIFESTQTTGVADGLKNMYFDIITAAFPNLIAEQLFSVQPLRQKMGQIFFLKYLYGSSKGNIKKGDEIFTFNNIAGYDNRNYTGEIVEDEAITECEAGNTVKTFTGNLAYIPLIPGTVHILAGAVTAVDNGQGVLTGTGVTGTINYATGAYEITYTTAPVSTDIAANYEFDMGYAPSTIPEIDIQIADTIIQSRPRKLRGTYSLDAGYDLQMAQGINIQDTLLEAAAAQLKHETDGDLIRDVFAQAHNTISWNSTYSNQTQQLSKLDFYQDFIDVIVKGSSMIRQETKRVTGNWIVCGKQASDILSFIGAPRFVFSGNASAVGPHYAGMLDNKWKVYFDPFLGENEFLIGYKGDTLVDAGMVYAPYLPFFATQTLMMDDFVGRRGFATSYGKKMVNAKLYTKGTITSV